MFATLLLLTVGVSWYGPAEISFGQSFSGDPYDPAVNDVRVVFQAGDHKEERLAYFDAKSKSWVAKFVTRQPGTYSATLKRNGELRPESASVKVENKMESGFIRRTETGDRFAFDNGSTYYPLGINIGWAGQGETVPEYLKKLGESGGNWARIWACHWDGKNPWWLKDGVAQDEFSSEPFEKWDAIVKAAEDAKVRFQFVLQHHGPYSSNVNSNWPQHPWNKANGGFLSKPEEFFTHPEALRRTKIWFRYVVARYAHSPGIMAWELFNEVEWVDAMKTEINSVAKWHLDMAAYLRNLDPYGRLVTTSSTMEHPEIWKAMDFYQPHSYPPDVLSAIAGTENVEGKPLFFGEFGNTNVKDQRKVINDGIWGSILADHAGTAAYWYWDLVKKDNLWDAFQTWNKIIAAGNIADRRTLKPSAEIIVETRNLSKLTVAPGRGWANSEVLDFELPQDAVPENLGQLSGYIQNVGTEKKAMMRKPLTLKFDAPAAGTLAIYVGDVSGQGAKIRGILNGEVALLRDIPARTSEGFTPMVYEVFFEKGPNEFALDSAEKDWFLINKITIDNLSSSIRGQGVADLQGGIFRFVSETRFEAGAISNSGLKDGKYKAQIFDLTTGKDRKTALEVKRGSFKITANNSDEIWIINR